MTKVLSAPWVFRDFVISRAALRDYLPVSV
jgi:hypothetical protein